MQCVCEWVWVLPGRILGCSVLVHIHRIFSHSTLLALRIGMPPCYKSLHSTEFSTI